MVVHVMQREVAQARRQGVLAVVVRNAQGPLEGKGAPGLFVDFRKAERQPVASQLDHTCLPPCCKRLRRHHSPSRTSRVIRSSA